MIALDGRVLLLDFGIAKARERLARTSVGVVKGKLGYMSPRRIVGQGATPACDLWSLGVTCWEMLAMRPLFASVEMAEVGPRIVRREIPPLGSLRPDLPGEVQELVNDLLGDGTIESAATAARRLRILLRSSGLTEGDACTIDRTCTSSSSAVFANEVGSIVCVPVNGSLVCFDSVGRTVVRTIPPRWAKMAVGGQHACGIVDDGQLECVGDNLRGQLGLGLGVRSTTTAGVVRPDLRWLAVGADVATTCALDSSHAVWCWGHGGDGQLGMADTSSSSVPLRVVDGAVKQLVMGSGSACAIRDDGSSTCWGFNAGNVLGTLRYVSPEQAQAHHVGPTSDVYSTAVVLHELLTGRIMVSPEKPVEMLGHVLLSIAAPVHELNPALPVALSPVIAKGLAKDPKVRSQTAAAFRAAILEVCPDLASTPAAEIAGFMRERFPEDLAALERFRALADGAGQEPPDSKTRTAMVSKSQVVPMSVTPAEPVLLTKTGFNFPMIPSTTVAPTRIVEISAPASTEPRAQPDPLRDRRLVRNAMMKGAAIATGLLTALIATGVALFVVVERPAQIPPTTSTSPPSATPVLGVQAKPATLESPPNDVPVSPEQPPARAARPARSPSARLPAASSPDVAPRPKAPVNDVRKLEAMATEAANSQLGDPVRVEFIRRARSFMAAVPESDRAPVEAAYQAATRRGAGGTEFETLARTLARAVPNS